MHEFACVPGFYSYGYSYGSTTPPLLWPRCIPPHDCFPGFYLLLSRCGKKTGAVYEITKSVHTAP